MRTRVGYAGGTSAAPTYQSIGDHSEAIEIDFDPEVIEYAELARMFFAWHNPCSSPWSTQYRSAAFPRNADQRRILEEAAKDVADSKGKAVKTAIEDFTSFTLAEDYHQKYRLRRIHTALEEFEAMFPTTDAFLGSVAVTKANAYVGGYATSEDLRSDDPAKGKLGQLGLSELAQASILKASR